MEQGQFKIYIFKGLGGQLFDNTPESAWQAIQTIPLTTSIFTITEDMIIEYDWQSQTIQVVNPGVITGEEPPWVLPPGGGSFLVMFDDQRVFGGALDRAGTARLIRYPVMLLRSESFNEPVVNTRYNKTLTYSFHPQLIAVDDRSLQSIFPAHDPAMTQPVHDYLEAIGKLK